MTLVLSNEDVERLLSITECMDVLESTYIEMSEGRSVNRVRSDCLVPSKRPDAIYSLKSMDAVIPALGVGAVSVGRPARAVLARGQRDAALRPQRPPQ